MSVILHHEVSVAVVLPTIFIFYFCTTHLSDHTKPISANLCSGLKS